MVLVLLVLSTGGTSVGATIAGSGSFTVGDVTGDVTGDLTGTASTATAAGTAYGITGSPNVTVNNCYC